MTEEPRIYEIDTVNLYKKLRRGKTIVKMVLLQECCDECKERFNDNKK